MAASKSQNLTTNVKINAHANGFSSLVGEIGRVGDSLLSLGNTIDTISQYLIDFGEQSVEVYKNYEKSMAEAEVALATSYGQHSAELDRVMKQLDEAATQWAASTIFHTNDVANAIAEAARSGWDYEKIMEGIPAAMELAEAGSLDLSQSVDMIVKIANAAGIEFENIGQFIDHWAYTANSSATTIGEMGDAMMRLGATMQFSQNTDELLTLVATMANAGYTGSEAGTLIRNTLMRIIAPTDKASDAMETLGATSEELEEIMNDEALAAASLELAQYGFSAYDSQGRLKSVLQIFTDMGVALAEMSGGFGDISKNEKAMHILGTVFGTRSVTGALTMIQAAAREYDGLYAQLTSGAAENYGAFASETMMDTLYGNIEIFESKVEALKQHVGEIIAPDLSDFLGDIGGIIDAVNGLDEGTFNALVKGLGVIAFAGPALGIAGVALKGIAALATPMGLLGLSAIGVAAFAAAVKEVEEVDFQNLFGNMEVDNTEIKNSVQLITDDFNNAYTYVDKFKNALGEAKSSYETASAAFSSKIFEKMVIGATLTDNELTQLKGLGTTMFESIEAGIATGTAKSLAFWDMLFGDPSERTPEEQAAFAEISGMLTDEQSELMNRANEINDNIQGLLTKWANGGKVTPEDRELMLAYFRDYNRVMAEAAAEAESEEALIQAQVLYDKAQTASWEEQRQISADITTARDERLEIARNNYAAERARIERNGGDPDLLAEAEAKYKEHEAQIYADYGEYLLNLSEGTLIEGDKREQFNQLEEMVMQYLSGESEWSTPEALNAAFTSLYGSSSLAGQAEWGNLIGKESDRHAMGRILDTIIQDLGGVETVESLITTMSASSNAAVQEMAQRYATLYAMQQLLNNYGTTEYKEGSAVGNYTNGLLGTAEGVYNSQAVGLPGFLAAAVQGLVSPGAISGSQYVVDENGNMATRNNQSSFQSTMEAAGYTDRAAEGRRLLSEVNSPDYQMFNSQLASYAHGVSSNAPSLRPDEQASLSETLSSLWGVYDFQKAREELLSAGTYPGAANLEGESLQMQAVVAQWLSSLTPAIRAQYETTGAAAPVTEQEPVEIQAEVTEVDTSQVQEAVDEQPPVELPATTEPVSYLYPAENGISLEEQGFTVNVDGDTTQLVATIQDDVGKVGENLVAYVDGDTGQLHYKIFAEDGQVLTEAVKGNTSMLRNAIDEQGGRVITVWVEYAAVNSPEGAAGLEKNAQGGRATEAAIFGEAGPEWAIPEEHTQRTAELLDAARAASGFTWPDLISRLGGLNANASNTPTTIVYSPVINAADVTGVRQALAEDKSRLEKWFAEHQMREAMEVYT